MNHTDKAFLSIKKLLALFFVVCLLFACVQIKHDYIVKENSERSLFAPAWIIQSKAYKIDSSVEAKQYRYFVSDAYNANQRLCLKSSETNATKKIASDVTREIVNRSAKKNKKITIDAELKDNLEKNILINLYDTAVAGQYWEKRDYLKEKGAKKDYSTYKCDTVVKIKKSALIKAIEASQSKTVKMRSNKDIVNAIDSYIAYLKIEY